jgi:hypothetical protein
MTCIIYIFFIMSLRTIKYRTELVVYVVSNYLPLPGTDKVRNGHWTVNGRKTPNWKIFTF